MLKHPGRPKQDKNVPRGTIKSSKDVAKEAGVSEPTVRRAKQALSVAPEKADAMISGKTTPTKVIQEHKEHVSVERVDSNPV